MKKQELIFLHGTFYQPFLYEEFIGLLEKKYKVYVPRMPMHGKPNSNVCNCIGDLIKDIRQYIISNKIENPILCGHSGGAVIAMEYAIKYNAKRIILIDPAGLPYYKSFMCAKFRMFLKSIINFRYGLYKALVCIVVSSEIYFRNIFNKEFRCLLREGFEKDYSEDMKKISCPVSVWWGRQDILISRSYAKVFEQNIKNANVKVVDGGHDWPIFKASLIDKHEFI